MRRLLGCIAASLVLLSGCTSKPGAMPGEARVDVDTPSLRRAKDAAGVETCPSSTSKPVDGGLPDRTLPCFGGGPAVNLSGLRGPMVVTFWGSWCGPCRDEMPVLQRFYERYGDEVGLLGVDFQDPQVDGAMRLIDQSGATYPQVADPGGDLDRAAPLPGLQGLPFLALVDGDGRVVHEEFVIIDDVDELRAMVEDELGVTL